MGTQKDGKVVLTYSYHRFLILMALVVGHLSKTNLCTIKYHRMLHLILQLTLFGALKGTSAGLYDALHPAVTRHLYNQTNKHPGFLDKVARKVKYGFNI